jgi:hypothetical protein
MNISDILPLININGFEEGEHSKEIKFPDGRSIEITYRLEYIIKRAAYDSVDGMNSVTALFSLINWTGYDAEGAEVPVAYSVDVDYKIQELLNEQL